MPVIKKYQGPYSPRLKTNKPEYREFQSKYKTLFDCIKDALNNAASTKEQRLLAKELIYLARIAKRATEPSSKKKYPILDELPVAVVGRRFLG